jgi:hypothetical protein
MSMAIVKDLCALLAFVGLASLVFLGWHVILFVLTCPEENEEECDGG